MSVDPLASWVSIRPEGLLNRRMLAMSPFPPNIEKILFVLVCDFVNDSFVVPGDNPDVSAEHLIYLSITGINPKRPPTQRMDLPSSAHNDNVVLAHFFDHSGADLLIPPAKEVALSTDGGDDDLGFAPFNELQQLRLVHVGGDRFPLSNDIHADQRFVQTQPGCDRPGRGSWSDDVKPAVLHGLSGLIRSVPIIISARKAAHIHHALFG